MVAPCLKFLCLTAFFATTASAQVQASISLHLLGRSDYFGEINVPAHSGIASIPYSITLSPTGSPSGYFTTGDVQFLGSNFAYLSVGAGLTTQAFSSPPSPPMQHASGVIRLNVAGRTAGSGGGTPKGMSVSISLVLPAGTPCPFVRETYADIGQIHSFSCVGAPLRIIQTSLQEARVGLNGASQSETLMANGGVPPYRWQLRAVTEQIPTRFRFLRNTTEGTATVQIGLNDPNRPSSPPLKFGSYSVFLEVTDNSPTPQSKIEPFTYKVSCGVNPEDDSDQDALKDCWELGGIDSNGDGTSDFLLAGALPTHKDIYVEVDWMQHHKPLQSALDLVKKSFARAPITNAEGGPGINLHIDVDPNPATGHIDIISFETPFSGGVSDFDSIKQTQFGLPEDFADSNRVNRLAAKRQAYRYALFAHRFSILGIHTNFSGRAELPGNDFLITLGGDDFRANITGHHVGDEDEQAGTFMHELGHTLGLRHGGDENERCKPNYVSVMNYTLQFSRMVGSRPLDYSRENLPSLFPARLDERRGIGSQRPGAFAFGPPPGYSSQTIGGVDWNGNGTQDSAPLTILLIGVPSFRICGLGLPDRLSGYDDWKSLVYDFRTSSDFADGAHLTSGEAGEVELTLEDWDRASKDHDGDGILSSRDNCPIVYNPDQLDSVGDGSKGDACRNPPVGDVNRDMKIDCVDIQSVRFQLGSRLGDIRFDGSADFNNDGIVDARDLQVVARAIPAGTVCR